MSAPASVAALRESALQRVLMAWIVAGLSFMLLPGTFLGVWNLFSIAGSRGGTSVDPAWIQAHGHAQIFGWIGSFILGIGFYSLSKMGGAVPEFAVKRAWISWGLWCTGVALRWTTNVWQWNWRWMLPLSAVLELCGFVVFFVTVSGHRSDQAQPSGRSGRPAWILLVMAGSFGFMASLSANLAVSIQTSLFAAEPAVPHAMNARLLMLFTWAFPVLTVWGFSARWLPVFLGLDAPLGRRLLAALVLNELGVVAALLGWWTGATVTIVIAVAIACSALHIFAVPIRPPKVKGVHRTFPFFVRAAYVWLLVSALLAVFAALWDRSGGLWGSSRHALTVGFMATMVFAIGQRVLPAFCGMRVLYSPALMLWSLVLLNAGCLLRVASEIGAYESYMPSLWPLLPGSAVLEMAAVTLFALNLLITFRQVPPHLAGGISPVIRNGVTV